MSSKPTPHEDEILACEVCFKEIPVSAVKSDEASDYIHHYCGLECFAKWQAQEEEELPADE